jgi:flotillin
MDIILLIALLAIVLVVIAGFVLLFKTQYRKAGPNEALIISGGKQHFISLPDGTKKEIGFRFRIGGGTFLNPFTERAETLPIEVITVQIKTPEVLTSGGVPIIADAVAQVKIDSSDYSIYLASTHFLGRGTDGIREVAQTVLEGKVREVIGTMTVEQIYTGRHEFSQLVYKAVASDFANMGLVMISFGLKDISDTQGYLEALSKPHIAAAKYEAAVAQAERDKQIAIVTANARKEGEIARLKAEAEIAGASWANEAKKAESQVAVNKKKAHSDMAYEMERFKIQQELTREEYGAKRVELEEQIKLEEMNTHKKQKELQATVVIPAEAKKKQVQMEADAESYRISTEAKGRLEVKKNENSLEAERIKSVGAAEADAIANKAKAYEKYNQAALYHMVMEKLPEIAKSVSEPLSKIEKIVMIETDGKLGTSKLTGQITDVLSQLPEVVDAVTGIDLKKVLKEKLSGKKE